MLSKLRAFYSFLILALILHFVVFLGPAYSLLWTQYLFFFPAYPREEGRAAELVAGLVDQAKLPSGVLESSKLLVGRPMARGLEHESTLKRGYLLILLVGAESCNSDGCILILAEKDADNNWQILFQSRTNGTVYKTDRVGDEANSGSLRWSWCLYGDRFGRWLEWNGRTYVEKTSASANGQGC